MYTWNIAPFEYLSDMSIRGIVSEINPYRIEYHQELICYLWMGSITEHHLTASHRKTRTSFFYGIVDDKF